MKFKLLEYKINEANGTNKMKFKLVDNINSGIENESAMGVLDENFTVDEINAVETIIKRAQNSNPGKDMYLREIRAIAMKNNSKESNICRNMSDGTIYDIIDMYLDFKIINKNKGIIIKG